MPSRKSPAFCPGQSWRRCGLLLAGWLFVLAGQLQFAPPSFAQAPNQDSISEVVARLQSDVPAIREAAVTLLGEMAEKARSQLTAPERVELQLQALRETGPEIARLVRDPSAGVRRAAVMALGRVRAPGTVAAQAWTQVLQHDDPSVRLAVVRSMKLYLSRTQDFKVVSGGSLLVAIEQYLRDGADLVSPFRTAMRDPSPEVVEGALSAFDTWIDLLDELPEATVGLVGENAAEVARIREAIPRLARSLRDLVPDLVAVLRQGSARQQEMAAVVIEQIARLLDQRTDEQRGAERRPRGRLQRLDLGVEAQEAVRTLNEALEREVPTLTGLLGRVEAPVQLSILYALEILGPKAAAAAPVLVNVLQSCNPFLRWSAARALNRIGLTDDVGPTILGLAALVHDEDQDLRLFACQVLETTFAAQAGPAVASLACAITSRDSELQLAAAEALNKIADTPAAPALKGAVPALTVALGSSDPRLLKLVPPILAKVGPAAAPAVPALRRLLDDNNRDVRRAAAEAILKIEQP